jgi:ATP-binding cassette subfamily C protein CydD
VQDQAALEKAALTEIISLGAGDIRAASRISVLDSVLWLPQAGAIAILFGGLVSGQVLLSPVLSGALFALIAALRAWLGNAAEKRLFEAAQASLDKKRRQILQAEGQRNGTTAFGGAGAVAALATEKLNALTPYVTRYVPAMARVKVVPIIILGIAFYFSWAVGLVLLIAGPLIPVFMALIGWAAKEASARQMVEIGALNDLLVDKIAALGDLRLLGATGRALDDFHRQADDLRTRTMAVLRVAFLSSTVLELFAALGVAMVAVWVGFSLLNVIAWGDWGRSLSPEAGILLLLLAPDYFQPLRDMAAAWHDRAAAQAVAAEMVAWEQEKGTDIVGAGAPAAALSGAADFGWSGLALRRGARRIVYPDCQIPAGTKLAICGPSGAGKTALLRMLAGLEPASEGIITVCGQRLSDQTADAWRARLGWMPQVPHFLDDSLKYNVAFGSELDEGLLRQAALGDVIARLPGGAASELGETGAGISGGEARRVMLARAFHAKPDVLLADEPTADLDAQTAAQVTQGLLDLAGQGVSLVIATHDPALMAHMDQVIEVGK